MAGLDPAIHVFAQQRVDLAERDARIKSGHDEKEYPVGETARTTGNQAALEIAPTSLSTITGDSKYSIEGSAPRRSRMPALQASL